MSTRPAWSGRRWRLLLLLPLALAAAFLATTRVTWTGRRAGLYLLRGDAGRPLELADDLRLGDEARVLGGFELAGPGRWVATTGAPGPRLQADWDGADGSGLVTSVLADGRVLETAFGRYRHDDGRAVHGLFVGGARAGAIRTLALDESGMSLRDPAGWHHVWCTVNEAWRLEADGRVVAPPDWSLVAARAVVATAARVVLESEHRLEQGGARLAMHRRVTFEAGQPFFRLEVRLTNLGGGPVVLTYGYGDEPWVGRYGSADGNVGWLRSGLVERAHRFSTRLQRWAGIVDLHSGLANFLAWGEDAPDLVYFSNHAGPAAPAEVGAPLSSNEVFVGLEWDQRRLEPGATLPIHLVVGLAGTGPDGRPALPEGALGARP